MAASNPLIAISIPFLAFLLFCYLVKIAIVHVSLYLRSPFLMFLILNYGELRA